MNSPAAEIIVPIVAMLSVFGSLFGIAFMFFNTRNKERMAMIEKGIDPMIFRQESNKKASRWALKLGILAMGIGAGIFSAFLLENSFGTKAQEFTTPFSIFFFAGLSLLISFVWERRLDARDN